MYHSFKDMLIKFLDNLCVIMESSNIKNNTISFYRECVCEMEEEYLVNTFIEKFKCTFDDIIEMNSANVRKKFKSILVPYISKDVIKNIFSSRIIKINRMIIWNYLLKLCEISLYIHPDNEYATKVRDKLNYIDSLFL